MMKHDPRYGYYEDEALFNCIKDPLLKSYNRAVMAIHLLLNVNHRVYKQYIGAFNQSERQAVVQMIERIEKGEDHDIKKTVKYRLNYSIEDNRIVYDAWIRGTSGNKWNWY